MNDEVPIECKITEDKKRCDKIYSQIEFDLHRREELTLAREKRFEDKIVEIENISNEINYPLRKDNRYFWHKFSSGHNLLTFLCSDKSCANIDLIRLILGKTADLLFRNKEGMTALACAVSNNNTVAVNAILATARKEEQLQKQLTILCNCNRTPLFIAALHGAIDAFKGLVAAGADIRYRNDEGKNLFHILAQILKCPYNVEEFFSEITIILGLDEISELLNAVDKNQKTPFDIANANVLFKEKEKKKFLTSEISERSKRSRNAEMPKNLKNSSKVEPETSKVKSKGNKRKGEELPPSDLLRTSKKKRSNLHNETCQKQIIAENINIIHDNVFHKRSSNSSSSSSDSNANKMVTPGPEDINDEDDSVKRYLENRHFPENIISIFDGYQLSDLKEMIKKFKHLEKKIIDTFESSEHDLSNYRKFYEFLKDLKSDSCLTAVDSR